MKSLADLFGAHKRTLKFQLASIYLEASSGGKQHLAFLGKNIPSEKGWSAVARHARKMVREAKTDEYLKGHQSCFEAACERITELEAEICRLRKRAGLKPEWVLRRVK